MTVVYKKEYITMIHHEDLDLLESVMRFEDEDTLRRHLLKSLEVMEQYNPDKLLLDMREFKLVVDPDFEQWVDENINARQVEFGIVKEAIIMSSDFNINLGAVEVMDNEYGSQIESATFLIREQAMDWLKETGHEKFV